MPDFRRYFVAGGTYFFTLVTARRSPLLRHEHARTLLAKVMREARKKAPLQTVAIVLLPDHLHTIWTLPPGDDDYPSRWQGIKANFTSRWLALGGDEQEMAQGYRRQRRRGVWQPRFMEHTIRDEQDLHNHADYIHYNPVKHGHVCSPRDWPWSSFHRYVRTGDYPPDWGSEDMPAPRFCDIDESLLE